MGDGIDDRRTRERAFTATASIEDYAALLYAAAGDASSALACVRPAIELGTYVAERRAPTEVHLHPRRVLRLTFDGPLGRVRPALVVQLYKKYIATHHTISSDTHH